MSTLNLIPPPYKEGFAILGDIELEFEVLSQIWKKEIEHVSLLHKMLLLDSYKQIIDMKEKVIPFLLKDLEKTQDFWFDALEQISGAKEVVPKEHFDDYKKMTEDWLSWGKTHNYI